MSTTKEELQRQVGQLESRLDQVETEFHYLNKLLLDCGFPEGIHTLKYTIEELMKESSDPFKLPPEFPPTQTLDPFH